MWYANHCVCLLGVGARIGIILVFLDQTRWMRWWKINLCAGNIDGTSCFLLGYILSSLWIWWTSTFHSDIWSRSIWRVESERKKFQGSFLLLFLFCTQLWIFILKHPFGVLWGSWQMDTRLPAIIRFCSHSLGIILVWGTWLQVRKTLRQPFAASCSGVCGCS